MVEEQGFLWQYNQEHIRAIPMIAAMTTAALVSYSPMTTRGSSDAATFVAQQAVEARRSLQKSFSLGFNAREVFNELFVVAEECKDAGWDGQDAAPVSADSYQAAYRFFEALPFGTPPPSVGAEPDGEITLEWYRSPRRVASISFSKEGEIHYAALVGPSKAYGTEPFFGDIPRSVIDLLARVTSA